jgi:hypothetical protein
MDKKRAEVLGDLTMKTNGTTRLRMPPSIFGNFPKIYGAKMVEVRNLGYTFMTTYQVETNLSMKTMETSI